jgi:prepilin-type N-terminal cleavage/methylation domain-containing protein
VIRKEQGYTLVELLVATAISGIIFVAVGTAMYQFTTVSGYGNDKLTAGHEVQHAAYWFTLDVQSAVTASGGNSLNLILPSGQTITYTLTSNNLQRYDGSAITTVAENIASISFIIQDRMIFMDITASIPGRNNVNEQGIYQVYMRPLPQ